MIQVIRKKKTLFKFILVKSFKKGLQRKKASYLHHTAQPNTLAAFPPWGFQRELVV